MLCCTSDSNPYYAALQKTVHFMLHCRQQYILCFNADISICYAALQRAVNFMLHFRHHSMFCCTADSITCYAALQTHGSNSAACSSHMLLFQLSITINSGYPTFIIITQYNKTSCVHVHISRLLLKRWIKEWDSLVDERIILNYILK
jgi:hypothetical protein